MVCNRAIPEAGECGRRDPGDAAVIRSNNNKVFVALLTSKRRCLLYPPFVRHLHRAERAIEHANTATQELERGIRQHKAIIPVDLCSNR